MHEVVTFFSWTPAGKFYGRSDADHKTDQGKASLVRSDVGKADFCRGHFAILGSRTRILQEAELRDGLMCSQDACDES